MTVIRPLLLPLFALAMLWIPVAHADCTVSSYGSQDMGTAPSSNVYATAGNFTVSSNFACTGFVNLLDYNRIDATLVAADFALTDATSGAKLPYSLYTDSSRAEPFTLGMTKEYGSFNLVDLLGLFGADGTIPLYLTTAVANLPAGTYTDTLNIAWDWDYCYGIGALGICLGRDSGSTNTIVTLTLTIASTCAVVSPDVHLGAVSFLTEAVTADMPVDVTCTKSHSFQVYVDGGDHWDGSRRNMVNGADRIAYEILTQDQTQPVGPTLVDAQGDSGTGNSQALTFKVRTLPEPTLPPAGVYVDNVRVIVEY